MSADRGIRLANTCMCRSGVHEPTTLVQLSNWPKMTFNYTFYKKPLEYVFLCIMSIREQTNKMRDITTRIGIFMST